MVNKDLLAAKLTELTDRIERVAPMRQNRLKCCAGIATSSI